MNRLFVFVWPDLACEQVRNVLVLPLSDNEPHVGLVEECLNQELDDEEAKEKCSGNLLHAI